MNKDRSKNGLLFLLGMCFVVSLSAQQRPINSSMAEYFFTVNPAATAPANLLLSGVSYENNNRSGPLENWTGRLYTQYPLQEDKMSVGAYFFHDQLGSMQQTQFMFTYAYQIPLTLFSDEGRLKIGLAVGASFFQFNWPELIVQNPTDPYLPDQPSKNTTLQTGGGLMYTSSGDYLQEGFFMAASIQPLYRKTLQLVPVGNFREAYYSNFATGFNTPLGEDFIFQLSVSADLTFANVLRPGIRVGIEKWNTFWGGFSYNQGGTMAAEAGYAFLLKSDDPLRIGLTYYTQTGPLSGMLGSGLAAQVSFRYKIYY